MSSKLNWELLSQEQQAALKELKELIHGTIEDGYNAVNKCDELRRIGQDVGMATSVEMKVLAGMTAHSSAVNTVA